MTTAYVAAAGSRAVAAAARLPGRPAPDAAASTLAAMPVNAEAPAPRRLDLPALIAEGGRSYSFEFFPPKTERGEQVLHEALAELEPLRPTFVSVTYGAGGTTQERTVRIIGRIAAETSLTPVGHLTCVGATRAELIAVIEEYRRVGVGNVLALRGDPPEGPGGVWRATEGGLTHAVELVELLRAHDDWGIGVAAFPEGHPEAVDLQTDAKVLADKQQAGAEFAVTQFFFRPEDYFALVERARGCGATLPIIPGIMPVTNARQIQRFAQLSGADFPVELAARFEAVEDDPEAVRALGVELATQLCRDLLAGGAPGLHFYTLNRSTATREIYGHLGLAPTPGA
jgi:methylenetetrahydrofolate reductase (NADPH)